MTDLQAEGLRIAEALQGAEAIADPIERYRALTEVQPAVDALVSAVKVARGAALAELWPARSYRRLADELGFDRYQTVQNLIDNAARAAQREEQQ